MVDIAEKEFKIPIRKDRYPDNRPAHEQKRKVNKFYLWVIRE